MAKPNIKLPRKKARKGPRFQTLSIQQVQLSASEKAVQEEVMNRLQRDKWLVVRFNSGAFRTARSKLITFYIVQGLQAISGFPDVLALKGDVQGGRFLLLEIKDHKGKLTESQTRFHAFAKRFNITVHIVRHPDELSTILEKELP